MSADQRKRQKKLERRTAKRREKKHSLVKQKNAGIAERLHSAAKYAILHCRVSENFYSDGIGWVLVSRQIPGGSVAVAVFLVDRFCLGVKDAFARITGGFSYESDFLRKMGSEFRWHDVTPATARKLVEEAVAYAARFGIAPHADYHKAKAIFGDINAAESTEVFEFGKDGKPFFVPGPNDAPDRCRQIVALLTHACGAGGFNYLVAVRGASLAAPGSSPEPALEGSATNWLYGPDDDEEDE
jgi:hypothetical protein